jgi:ubiquinone/menaquinone biosynthesis C-methylase UbiE
MMETFVNTKDPHCFSHLLDDATTQRLIARLESRAKDAVFTNLFDQYIEKLRFPDAGRTLEIGCGSGAMSRALIHKENFSGALVGIDQSAAFIEAARCFAADENAGESLEFHVGDVHKLDFDDESFDVVILHTLISHVADTEAALKEIARITRKGGTVAIFDGDYSSLTYATVNRELGRQMDHALATTTFNNPLVMRDLIRLLPEVGLKVTETLSNVVSEIGNASYFKSFAETYAPMVASGGLMSQKDVDNWFAEQNSAMNDGTFFASCNYYAYLSQKV